MSETYENRNGVEKPLYELRTLTGSAAPYRVMARGVEVASFRLKGVAKIYLERLKSGDASGLPVTDK